MEVKEILSMIREENELKDDEKKSDHIISQKSEKLKKILNKIGNEPIAIYGTGQHTKKLMDYINFDKFNFIGLIDYDTKKIGHHYFGFKVYDIETVIPKVKHIIISSLSFQDIIYERISWVEKKGINVIKLYDKDDFQIERIYLVDDDELKIKQNVGIGEGLYRHLNRYMWIKPFCFQKNVLDIACGCGYGTSLLAESANKITGVDIDEKTIKYAKKYFKEDNVNYVCCSIENFESRERYDLIVSYETIEHILNEKIYIMKIKRMLKDNGIFIVSTPASIKNGHSTENKYHVNEYTEDRFVRFLRQYFNYIDFYVQDMKTGAIIFREAIDGKLEDFENNNFRYIMIAVCRK